MTIVFFVPGSPQGKGRPRATKRGAYLKLYTPSKTVSYESSVALFASQSMQGRSLLDGPCAVSMVIKMMIPKSMPKYKRLLALQGELFPVTKPDADNVVKAIFDAINGVVWKDDVQVVDLSVSKRYSEIPGVEVSVRSIVND